MRLELVRAGTAGLVILIASVSLAPAPGDWPSGNWIPADVMLFEPAMMVRQVDDAAEPPGASSGGAGAPDSVLDRLREAEMHIAELRAELQQQRETQHLLDAPPSRTWYERLSLRGYTQFRINQSIWEAPDSAPPHHAGDRSVRANQNFLIRRARLILAGDVSDHIYVYLQPDFAVTTPGSPDGTHYLQLRDWYADLYLDIDKVYRFRLGQSKVPYGWENMQSSSNRLPLDRNDALNSAVRNERDLGLLFSTGFRSRPRISSKRCWTGV